jgi:hypothetical protein
MTSTAPISTMIHLGYDRTSMSVVGVSTGFYNEPCLNCNSVRRIDPNTGDQTTLSHLNPDGTAAFGGAHATDVDHQRMFV